MRFLLGVLIVISAAFGISLAQEDEHKHDQGEKQAQTTLTGELVDAHCLISSNGAEKGKSHSQCAGACMESGIPAGILPEGKAATEMLFLLTNPTVLAEHAAKSIKVEGAAYPQFHAFAPEKLWVREGSDWKEVTLK